MNLKDQIRRTIDQLLYNQLYAPNFPEEDRTSLDRQVALIKEQIAQAISTAEKREDIADWLRLGLGSIEVAFDRFRKADCYSARRDIESAVSYLRNASSEKPHKITFVTKTDGSTKPTSKRNQR